LEIGNGGLFSESSLAGLSGDLKDRQDLVGCGLVPTDEYESVGYFQEPNPMAHGIEQKCPRARGD